MKRTRRPILCVFSLFTFLSSITPAYAQPNDFTRFVTQSGEPARLSIFQEIPGFRSSLIDLDKDRNLLDLDNGWYSMSDTDVWVFFLKNESEASLLPSFVLDILKSYYDGSPSFSILGEIELDGMTTQRLLYFIFLEKFAQNGLTAIGCDTATVLYFQLKQNGIQSIRDATNECYLG